MQAKLQSAQIREITQFPGDIEGKLFLTLDLDWAVDEIIIDTLELLSQFNTRATIFVTHDTHILKTMRLNKNLELGVHPNLEENLQNADSLQSLAQQRISAMKLIVPDAVSFRSHSTTNSSRIIEVARENGIQFDLNYFIEFQKKFHFSHWQLWNGMVRVPYVWTDDVYISESQSEFEKKFKEIFNWSGIKVINFHPIHIFLNSNRMDVYENSKGFRDNHNILSSLRSPGFGTRDKFLHLLNNLS